LACDIRSVYAVCVLLGLGVFSWASANSDATDVHKWKIHAGGDVYLSLEAENYTSRIDAEPPKFVIRCKEGKLEAYVTTPTAAASEDGAKTLAVTFGHGVDNETNGLWSVLASGNELFLDNVDAKVRWIPNLHSLSFDLPRSDGSTVKTTFLMAGLDEAMKPLRKSCTDSQEAMTPLIAGMGNVTSPILIQDSKVEPEFPRGKARDERVDGKVILQAIVKKDGTVRDVEVIRSDRPGYGFEEAAISAVSQWCYRPALQDDKPVEVYFTVVVEFSLR